MPVTNVKSTWVGGDLRFVTAANATICQVSDNTSGSDYPDLGYTVEGVAAGYKIARGSTAITATGNVAHGLTTCVAFSLQNVHSSAATNKARQCAVVGGKINGTKLAIYRFRASAANTYQVATVAGTVSWIAVGT